ncbi:ketopantoate reductase family protein [Paenibacillus sp. GCM10027626]|uniref:ketopantoate reductase family protein n=1 Tax=Paenibacillus sp. GCM10027626 TaxID=3273411 RepID=UPI003626A546
MRIYIVGAGAIGLLYGLRLSRAGLDVVLCTRTKEQAERLNEEGAVLQEDSRDTNVRVKACHFEIPIAQAAPEDWIWLTVKQTAIDEALLQKMAKLASAGAPVLCMQNGIGHLPHLQAVLPRSLLYVAVTTEGALKKDDRTVQYTGVGQVMLGLTRADQHACREAVKKSQKMLLDAMRMAGIATFLSNESKEIERRIYQKLLANAVINPLTAIYGVTNGMLPADSLRQQVMSALHSECISILRLAGMPFDEEAAWQQVLDICSRTFHNESSMLRDIRNGRETEIQWINGGISAMAKEMNLASPLNDAVIALIEAMKLKG